MFCLKEKANKERVYIWMAVLALLLLLVVSVCVGASVISPVEIVRSLQTGMPLSTAQKVLHIRLPRTFAAALAGAGLAVSGLLLQQVLHNSLCSPNIIGVNAGAGLFVVLASVFLPFGGVLFLPMAAFCGALLAVLLVFAIAKKTCASQKMIVLAGIAVNSMVGAISDAVVTLYPDFKTVRADFAIGSFRNIASEAVWAVLPYFIISLGVVLLFQYDLQLLSLGDEAASALGLHVRKVRLLFLASAALLAGISVSLGGLVGFVGLIVPHIAKMVLGIQAKNIVVFTAVSGAALCLLCDILARSLFSPYELPVGIILSALGSPFFLYLILRRKRGTAND